MEWCVSLCGCREGAERGASTFSFLVARKQADLKSKLKHCQVRYIFDIFFMDDASEWGFVRSKVPCLGSLPARIQLSTGPRSHYSIFLLFFRKQITVVFFDKIHGSIKLFTKIHIGKKSGSPHFGNGSFISKAPQPSKAKPRNRKPHTACSTRD